MISAYRYLCRIICICACAWALLVIYHYMQEVSFIQFTNESAAIDSTQDLSALNEAIADYESFISPLHCYSAVPKKRATLYLLASDRDLAHGSANTAAKHMEKAAISMQEWLGCKPVDGKAWLDYALILTEQSGFGPEALEAFKRSARVSPHESWLAELRLVIAVSFLPMLDKEAREFAQSDVRTLEHALSPRRRRILQKTQTTSLKQLGNLFVMQGE